jgi:hypothetical protein
LLFGIVLLVVGVQFVTMGLLGELVIRTYHESQGKPIYAIRAVETTDEGQSSTVHRPPSTVINAPRSAESEGN